MKKIRHRKLKKRIAAFLVMAEILVAFGGLTGCGKSSGDVPELMEPVSAVEAFRPAQKRRVGLISQYRGVVRAAEHPVFSQKSITLSEVKVGVGDYVNAGDTIAISYSSANQDQITAIQNEIAALTRERTYKKNISDENIKKLGYEKKIEEYLQNTDGINLKTKEILVAQENQRYDLAVIDNSLSEKRTSLSKLQEDSSTKTFTAPISGRVTFVKDITKSNAIEAYESIAVIADDDDVYIEVEDININNYKFDEYKSKWAFIGGKEVDIVERKYTNEERLYADSLKKNPHMGFDVPGADLTLGTDVLLFFMEEENTPKLTVGNDSISFDNGDYYIYVKTADGDTEKRIIDVGVSDGLYTEVKSGVEEGEMVFYQNTALMPKKYETAVASIGDYREEVSTKIINQAYPYYRLYTAEIGGIFKKIKDTGVATAGEALFSIESSVGPAQIAEAKDAIDDLDQQRTKSSREYQYNKKELEEDLKGADKIYPDMLATESDAAREYMYYAERKECDLNILNYEEDYASKEYSANRAIKQSEYDKLKIGTEKTEYGSDYVEYSESPGRISSINFENELTVEKGALVLTEELRGNDAGATKLLCMMDGPNASECAKIGQEVRLKQDDKIWTGTCIGQNGDDTRFTLLTDGDKPCVTYSAPFTKNVKKQFYVEMDAEITETDLMRSEMFFYNVYMEDVVLVPATSVKSEVSKLSLEEKYYVWKVEDGDIVKEYVDVFNPGGATSVKYILNGVEPGDTVLK